MKLSTLMLADFASVREGTLGVLGGYITQIWRPSFPEGLGATLVAVVSPDDDELNLSEFAFNFRFQIQQVGEPETLIEGTGEFRADLDNDREVHFPLIFGLQQVEIPSAGKFNISFFINDELSGTYVFYADLPPMSDD